MEEYIRKLAKLYWSSASEDTDEELIEHAEEVSDYISNHPDEFRGYVPQ